MTELVGKFVVLFVAGGVCGASMMWLVLLRPLVKVPLPIDTLDKRKDS